MSCENPVIIKNPRYKDLSFIDRLDYSWTRFNNAFPFDYVLSVPCGKCHACQKRRMRDFKIRLIYECSKYAEGECAFITLTFDQASLVRFKDSPNKAVRLFLDRCRKHFGESVRHWIVAEYGSLKGRIHYHGILFGLPKNFNTESLSRLWSYGFVFLGYVDPQKTAGYITKYITKNFKYEKSAPRIISSKGIGLGYLNEQNIRFHKHNGCFRPYMIFGNYKVPLPRYYFDKIFNDDDKIEMLFNRMCDTPTLYLEGKKYTNYYDYCKDRFELFKKNVRLKLSK